MTTGPSTGLQALIHERPHLIVQVILLQILCRSIFAILAPLLLASLPLFLPLVMALVEWYIWGEGTNHGFVGGGKVLLLLFVLVLEVLLFYLDVVHDVVDVFVDA